MKLVKQFEKESNFKSNLFSKKNVQISFVAMASSLIAAFPEIALAAGPELVGGGKTIGTISNNITASLAGAAGVVTALAYLGAISFAFIGALKWKAYGEQPDRTPLKVPVTYWGIAAICAALPEFIGTGITTLWGSGATLVSAI
jgi:hypothetical protein